MTDFYSVLKDSIIRRNLLSPAARYDVYGQAREAMIRRLWSLEPPLSEDEIDARIGLFDAAVEKIEIDLEESFAGADEEERQDSRERTEQSTKRKRRAAVQRRDQSYAEDDFRARSRPPRPPPPQRNDAPYSPVAQREPNHRGQANGRQLVAAAQPISRGSRTAPSINRMSTAQRRSAIDEDWLARNEAGPSKPRLRSHPGERTRPRARKQRAPSSDAYYDEAYEAPVSEGSFEYHSDTISGRRRRAANIEAPAVEYDAAPYPGDDDRHVGYPDEAEQDPPIENAAYYEYVDPEPDDAYYDAEQYENAYADDVPVNEVYDRTYEQPAARRQGSRRRPGKNARVDREDRGHQSGRRPLPILAIALAVIAIVLFAINAYIFIPILMGSDPGEPAAATAPSNGKADDRLPGLVSSARPSAATIPSSSAAAIEIPERNLNVAESIEIFRGNDPTVFEASSNNPIQFESDSEGGFARITSGVTAPGARAVIGPGIADRIAGRTVRVTLLARSSRENGAANMRFALQSGLAVSHWQSADLSSNYATYGMIWRVPAARTTAGDYLLIEPGIPGDGTSVDIRVIKIDIVNS